MAIHLYMRQGIFEENHSAGSWIVTCIMNASIFRILLSDIVGWNKAKIFFPLKFWEFVNYCGNLSSTFRNSILIGNGMRSGNLTEKNPKNLLQTQKQLHKSLLTVEMDVQIAFHFTVTFHWQTLVRYTLHITRTVDTAQIKTELQNLNCFNLPHNIRNHNVKLSII